MIIEPSADFSCRKINGTRTQNLGRLECKIKHQFGFMKGRGSRSEIGMLRIVSKKNYVSAGRKHLTE